MRIGELAAIAGVTTRTVRHYHRIGLLPEPERQPNGYREYGLRDAVELARVRRLTELGLSLDEVRDALADDAGKDLREILAELDADLARREEAIGRRRARLAELLRRADAGGLPAEGPVSAELAAVFDDMARASAARPGPEPAMAAKERELLALLDSTAGAGHRAWLLAMMRALNTDEDAMARAYQIYARLDELTDASPDDPRIPELARAIADSMPHEVARSAAEGASRTGDGDGGGFAEAFFADFPPAQAEVLRRAAALLQETVGGRADHGHGGALRAGAVRTPAGQGGRGAGTALLRRRSADGCGRAVPAYAAPGQRSAELRGITGAGCQATTRRTSRRVLATARVRGRQKITRKA